MNDQSAGWSPEGDGDDDSDQRRLRSSVERRLMERARLAAERDRQKGPRRIVQHALAFAAAVILVLVIFLGFDAFLTSVQKVMKVIDEQEQQQKLEQARPKPDEPMPAYVVPEE
jgi:hypothetical protein